MIRVGVITGSGTTLSRARVPRTPAGCLFS